MSDNNRLSLPLFVKIIEGRELIARDISGKSDPYCLVSLLDTPPNKKPKKIIKAKTQMLRRTLNPLWDFSCNFEIFEENKGTLSLHFKVMDWDRFSKDDFMGEVMIQLNTLNRGEEIEAWYPLQSRSANDPVTGDIKLRILLGQ